MQRWLILIGSIVLVTGSAFSAPTLEQRKQKIESMSAHVAPEALQRKALSEKILLGEGVPISKTLPVIETQNEAKLRSKDEIAYRALALLAVALKGEGLDQSAVDKIVAKYDLNGRLTPNEKTFIRDAQPSRHDRVQFSWRYEAAWVLLWALGYVDNLEKPVAACDVPRAVRLMKERSIEQFLAGARLRPASEILDQADRIYRYHWAVVEAEVQGRKAPAGLDSDVTSERHHALDWLIGYMDQQWDDVTTDT